MIRRQHLWMDDHDAPPQPFLLSRLLRWTWYQGATCGLEKAVAIASEQESQRIRATVREDMGRTIRVGSPLTSPGFQRTVAARYAAKAAKQSTMTPISRLACLGHAGLHDQFEREMLNVVHVGTADEVSTNLS